MELRLESGSALELRATLVNRGAGAAAVLHNDNLQPSRVVLRNALGVEVKPFDNRTRAKFDRTVRAAMFRQIPSGGSMAVGGGRFRKASDGKYQLDWGPYHYGELAPGVWQVSAVFEATIDTPTGGGKVAGAWKGTVTSGAVTVHLP